MTWTSNEKKKILEEYWADDTAYCPKDGASLDIKPEQVLTGRKTVNLYIRCPRCHEEFNSYEIEPEPASIDEYSDEEKREIVGSYFAQHVAFCPRHRATLITEFQEHTGGWFLLVRCPRCGRSFEWQKADNDKTRGE